MPNDYSQMGFSYKFKFEHSQAFKCEKQLRKTCRDKIDQQHIHDNSINHVRLADHNLEI